MGSLLTTERHLGVTLAAGDWAFAGFEFGLLAIGAALGLATQTVRNYLSSIYEKLGLHTRAEVVVWARERGLG